MPKIPGIVTPIAVPLTSSSFVFREIARVVQLALTALVQIAEIENLVYQQPNQQSQPLKFLLVGILGPK